MKYNTSFLDTRVCYESSSCRFLVNDSLRRDTPFSFVAAKYFCQFRWACRIYCNPLIQRERIPCEAQDDIQVFNTSNRNLNCLAGVAEQLFRAIPDLNLVSLTNTTFVPVFFRIAKSKGRPMLNPWRKAIPSCRGSVPTFSAKSRKASRTLLYEIKEELPVRSHLRN